MSLTDLQLTGLYALAIFTAGIAAVSLSGFFPLDDRPVALRREGGALLIALLATAIGGLTGTALWVGLTLLPWYTVIIAGGLSLLLAPLVFQTVPARFWDSRTGVGVATLVTGLLLLVLLRLYIW